MSVCKVMHMATKSEEWGLLETILAFSNAESVTNKLTVTTGVGVVYELFSSGVWRYSNINDILYTPDSLAGRPLPIVRP